MLTTVWAGGSPYVNNRQRKLLPQSPNFNDVWKKGEGDIKRSYGTYLWYLDVHWQKVYNDFFLLQLTIWKWQMAQLSALDLMVYWKTNDERRI